MDKFTKQDFLKLTDDEQLEWIESNIQDYEGLLYGDGYLGCSYPVEQIDVAEYEENRDDYGTSHIIQKAMGGLSLDRLEAIEDGAELTENERKLLTVGLSEKKGELKEYQSNHKKYAISSIIQKELGGLTLKRFHELEDGAEISIVERDALICAFAEGDEDGWLGHHSFPIEFKEGSLFTYFLGSSAGQGGATFEFVSIFETKAQLIEHVAQHPFASLEV